MTDRVNPLPSKRVLLAAGVFLLIMLAVLTAVRRLLFPAGNGQTALSA